MKDKEGSLATQVHGYEQTAKEARRIEKSKRKNEQHELVMARRIRKLILSDFQLARAHLELKTYFLDANMQDAYRALKRIWLGSAVRQPLISFPTRTYKIQESSPTQKMAGYFSQRPPHWPNNELTFSKEMRFLFADAVEEGYTLTLKSKKNRYLSDSSIAQTQKMSLQLNFHLRDGTFCIDGSYKSDLDIDRIDFPDAINSISFQFAEPEQFVPEIAKLQYLYQSNEYTHNPPGGDNWFSECRLFANFANHTLPLNKLK